MKLTTDTPLDQANPAVKIEDVGLLLTQKKTLVLCEEHAHTSILLDIITYEMEERALFNISSNLN